MDLSEYIAAVTGQMRCKRAQGPVARELKDHIEDQKAAYMAEGMKPEEAEAEAVRQMGDAVEVGLAMDRIHRPRLDKKMLVLVGIFSIVACIVQGMQANVMETGGYFFGDARESIVQVAIGFLLMIGILFLDYTYLAKKPLLIWALLFIALPLFLSFYANIFPYWYGRGRILERIYRLFSFGLFLPAYGGVIYYYRKRGWKGLLLCLLWLLPAVFLEKAVIYSFSVTLVNSLACLLLVTVAVASGWMQIPRLPGILTMWGVITCSFGGFLLRVLCFGKTYQQTRLLLFLGIETSGAQNYMEKNMRTVLQNLRFLGRKGQALADYSSKLKETPEIYPLTSGASFFFLTANLGIAAAILILAGFAVLFVLMTAGILKQKSVFGGITGTACLLGLFIPAIVHILSSLTLIPLTDMYIPFLYQGFTVNVACYTLLGLYLSVYRNTDVAA